MSNIALYGCNVFHVQVENVPIILHSFTVHMCDDRLLLFGGGGNCFSFGTHFNKSPIQISLQKSL